MPASPNATFTELVTTTLRHHKRKLVDNVTKHNGLLTLMKERGNIKTDASGGYEIALPLSYAENATYQRFSGYDTLNISQSDVISAARFDWQQAAIHVTASGREIKMNQSEERLINLVKSRVDVAMATAANNLSLDIYSDGSLPNQINGLNALVSTNGEGTVGGINSTANPFWRSKFLEVTGTGATYATLRAAMNTMWLSTTRGTDKPDVIVMSHDFFTIFESGLQDLQRYADARMGDLGFEALKYKSASVIFDDNANFGTTSETAYFLNTRYLYLMEHPDARWTEDDEKVPVNQDAVIVPVYWMGNLCVSNRSLQGRVIDAA